uniref:Uncharacterized protein n=2 Tax=Timema TaxID=61471 RepID=A0A7R9IEK1_9NEOP|nr:unnamed protein product [Timema tahoe]
MVGGTESASVPDALPNSSSSIVELGNHYGTPKPSKEQPVSPPQSSGSSSNLNIVGLTLGGLFPGAHPSSEGKRKRNRSNVEAMAAKNMEPELIGGNLLVGDGPGGGGGLENLGGPGAPPSYYHAGDSIDTLRSDLGPLPPNWEKAYTERGEVYFIDHNSGTSHWLDPRLSKFQKKSLEECLDDELPYGWEKIEDPHYGTYYIDHVNRKTQYENPVIQAKQAAQDDFERAFFTRNPNELRGERFKTTLVKSSRGLGFTIVGGDDTEEEFLQIKSVVPNGPAWLDGKLQTGDVLVCVNETCVLGFTHHDMVSVFQSITPGETVTLEVCRGYPLPFDPNDPNTEVVTTVAVTAPEQRPWSPAGSGSPRIDVGSDGLSFEKEGRCEENGLDNSTSSQLAPYDTCKATYSYSDSYDSAGQDIARSPLMQHLSDRLTSTTLQDVGPLHSTVAEYARSRSPANDFDSDTLPQREIWGNDHGHYDYKTGDSFSDNPYSSSGLDSTVVDSIVPSDRSPSTEYLRHYVLHPYYNGYEGNGHYDPGYGYGYADDNHSSDFVPHKEFGYPYSMPGYNPQVQTASSGSLPSSTSGYYSSKRKESTSFEHEQPHPSNVTRYPRDLRWLGLGPAVQVYPASPGLEWVETLVTLVRQETGFGFRIVGGTEEGSQVGAMVSIGHIVPGGAADLDGRLCSGDEIVSVDSQTVLSKSHHHVVQLMGKAAANGRVTLGIRRRIPTQDVSNDARSDIGYPYDVTVTRRESEGFGFVIISSVNKAGSTIDDTSSTASASQREDDGLTGEEEQYHAVELSRGTRGFGFSIRGGREFQNMPLFVLQIAENGPAALDGTLKIADQIIEINSINTKTMTHAEAIEIIRNGGPTVRLLVRRGGKVSLPPPIVGECCDFDSSAD